MEAKFEEEEKRCRMEIEAMLEPERKLREEQAAMFQNMVTVPGCKDLVRR